MSILEEEIRNCRKCALWRFRRNPVPGEGCLDASVVFVGEAPGYNEDLQGRPFVGGAGRLLDKLLSRVGLCREEVYIANVLKCRPPRNRDPKPSEAEACTPYLDRQIELIRPRLVMTLGRHSSSYVLSKSNIQVRSITRVRGRIFEVDMSGLEMTVIPTYHPAAALYNPKYYDMLMKDFELLKREFTRPL